MEDFKVIFLLYYMHQSSQPPSIDHINCLYDIIKCGMYDAHDRHDIVLLWFPIINGFHCDMYLLDEFRLAYDIHQQEREQQQRVKLAVKNGLLSVLSRYDPENGYISYMNLLHMCIYYAVCRQYNSVPHCRCHATLTTVLLLLLLLLFSQQIDRLQNYLFHIWFSRVSLKNSLKVN